MTHWKLLFRVCAYTLFNGTIFITIYLHKPIYYVEIYIVCVIKNGY